MRKLLLLSLLLVGCKPLLFIEVPPDMQLDTSFHAKNPHKVVLFVEHDVYYKQAQTNPDYRAAKEHISALLPPASNKCLCGITVRGGIVRIDGKKSWVIDIEQLPTIAALVLYRDKGKPEVVTDPKQYEKRLRKMWKVSQ